MGKEMELSAAAKNRLVDLVEDYKKELYFRAERRARKLGLDEIQSKQIDEADSELTTVVMSDATLNGETLTHNSASLLTPFSTFFVAFGGILAGGTFPELFDAFTLSKGINILTTVAFATGIFFLLSPFVEWLIIRARYNGKQANSIESENKRLRSELEMAQKRNRLNDYASGNDSSIEVIKTISKLDKTNSP